MVKIDTPISRAVAGNVPAAALFLCPLTLREANAAVIAWHRHHRPAVGQKYAIGVRVADGGAGRLAGAAIVGRPVAHALQDGYTAEVLRLVTDGTPNACSILYGAAARAWRGMGGRRILTYILATEPGTSLRAAGWVLEAEVEERHEGWDRPGRRRLEQATLFDAGGVTPQVAKRRYGRQL